MKILFLDDMEERIPVLREGEEVVYVRTPDEFKLWIIKHGVPDIISFDHDLSYDQYGSSYDYTDPNRSLTGTDCAKWLILTGLLPKRVIIHSWNVSGAQRIATCFEGYDIPVKICPFSSSQYLT